MKRIFVGSKAPAPTQSLILNTMILLQKEKKDARFYLPQELHVTLQFIGEMTDQEIENLNEDLKNLVQPKIKFQLDGVSTFDDIHQAKTIWMKIKENGELSNFQTLIQEKCRAIKEIKNHLLYEAFVPHITFMRTKEPFDLENWIQKLAHIKNEGTLESFAIYESIEGKVPKYVPLQTYLLK